VIVSSPSTLSEAGAVLRAIVAVAFVTAIAMTARFGAGDAPGRAGGQASGSRTTRLVLRPDQLSFAALPAEDQRMYRRCLLGLADAEELRSTTGRWPDVAELAARGTPPFSADPLDAAGYRWQRLLDGTLLNFLGVPADAASPRPSILVVVLEPDPGTPLDPTAVIDESHHKLRDGTLLHVSISLGTARTLGRPLAMPAFEDGWRQVIVSTPHTR
jgi:hypothetical protein